MGVFGSRGGGGGGGVVVVGHYDMKPKTVCVYTPGSEQWKVTARNSGKLLAGFVPRLSCGWITSPLHD